MGVAKNNVSVDEGTLEIGMGKRFCFHVNMYAFFFSLMVWLFQIPKRLSL